MRFIATCVSICVCVCGLYRIGRVDAVPLNTGDVAVTTTTTVFGHGERDGQPLHTPALISESIAVTSTSHRVDTSINVPVIGDTRTHGRDASPDTTDTTRAINDTDTVSIPVSESGTAHAGVSLTRVSDTEHVHRIDQQQQGRIENQAGVQMDTGVSSRRDGGVVTGIVSGKDVVSTSTSVSGNFIHKLNPSAATTITSEATTTTVSSDATTTSTMTTMDAVLNHGNTGELDGGSNDGLVPTDTTEPSLPIPTPVPEPASIETSDIQVPNNTSPETPPIAFNIVVGDTNDLSRGDRSNASGRLIRVDSVGIIPGAAVHGPTLMESIPQSQQVSQSQRISQSQPVPSVPGPPSQPNPDPVRAITTTSPSPSPTTVFITVTIGNVVTSIPIVARPGPTSVSVSPGNAPHVDISADNRDGNPNLPNATGSPSVSGVSDMVHLPGLIPISLEELESADSSVTVSNPPTSGQQPQPDGNAQGPSATPDSNTGVSTQQPQEAFNPNQPARNAFFIETRPNDGNDHITNINIESENTVFLTSPFGIVVIVVCVCCICVCCVAFVLYLRNRQHERRDDGSGGVNSNSNGGGINSHRQTVSDSGYEAHVVSAPMRMRVPTPHQQRDHTVSAIRSFESTLLSYRSGGDVVDVGVSSVRSNGSRQQQRQLMVLQQKQRQMLHQLHQNPQQPMMRQQPQESSRQQYQHSQRLFVDTMPQARGAHHHLIDDNERRISTHTRTDMTSLRSPCQSIVSTTSSLPSWVDCVENPDDLRDVAGLSPRTLAAIKKNKADDENGGRSMGTKMNLRFPSSSLFVAERGGAGHYGGGAARPRLGRRPSIDSSAGSTTDRIPATPQTQTTQMNCTPSSPTSLPPSIGSDSMTFSSASHASDGAPVAITSGLSITVWPPTETSHPVAESDAYFRRRPSMGIAPSPSSAFTPPPASATRLLPSPRDRLSPYNHT